MSGGIPFRCGVEDPGGGAFPGDRAVFRPRLQHQSPCVAETTDPDVSRITIVSSGDEQIIEQIIKQLHKLINTVKVVELKRTGTRGAGNGPGDRESEGG